MLRSLDAKVPPGRRIVLHFSEDGLVEVGEDVATIAGVTFLLKLVLEVAAILGAARIMYFFRARAMLRLASKWGFRYVGPTTPPQWWWNTSRPIIPAPLPGRFPHLGVSQVWNIIEGKNNGSAVFIFDGISEGARTQPCTFIACQTEQSPFPITMSVEPVLQIHGWTVLRGVRFGWFSWFMGIRRLDRHIDYLLN